MSRFWGGGWSKTIGVATPVVGAALSGAPRMVGWADGGAAPWYYAAGIALAGMGALYQLLDGHMVQRGRATFQRRLNDELASMHQSLAAVTGSSQTSVEQVKGAIAIVQNGTRLLIEPTVGNIRVSAYRIDCRDEPQDGDSSSAREREHLVQGKPIRDSMLKNLVFELVTAPSGRGTAQARKYFYFDEEGAYTLDRILSNKTVMCTDTLNAPTPGLKPDCSYAAFLVVPIIIDGSVEGMLACDSMAKGVLTEAHESTMRMTAMLAGIALQAGRIASVPAKQLAPVGPVPPASVATMASSPAEACNLDHTRGEHHG